ncbi:MAG: hypothetical protein O2887_16835 [Bacteroidetes bacterium]|nr:hypothetical protein [Bacteroidota bacterium]
MKKSIFFIAILILVINSVQAQNYIYKVSIIRAAPDRLLDLIELLKQDITNYEKLGIEKPYILRHFQGDQWDVLIFTPIESLEKYYSAKGLESRVESIFYDKPYDNIIWDYISYYEELFVNGPELTDVKEQFEKYDFYHIEMFIALAGKRRELLKEREMENDYLVTLGFRPNLIFNKVAGGKWDNFSIGFYTDIKDFFTIEYVDPIEKERSARSAGFEGTNSIGSYLRRFINEHHDTLAVAVKPQ